MSSLKEYFRPEFLNRLDDIIIFDILPPEAISAIVRIQVEIVKERLKAKNIELQIGDDVVNYLAKAGYNPQYGARPLKRLIQNKILNPIASLMISKGGLKDGAISISMKGEEFEFDVKKGKRGSMIKREEILPEISVAQGQK